MKRLCIVLITSIILFFGCTQKNNDNNSLIPIFNAVGTFSTSYAYLGPGQLSKASETLQTDDNQIFEIDYYPGTICYTTKNAQSEGIGYYTQSQFGKRVILVSSNHQYNIEGVLLQKTIKRLMEKNKISADSSLTLLTNFLWSKIPVTPDFNNINLSTLSSSIDIEKDKYKMYLLEIYNMWKAEKKDFLIVLKMLPIDEKDKTLIVFK